MMAMGSTSLPDLGSGRSTGRSYVRSRSREDVEVRRHEARLTARSTSGRGSNRRQHSSRGSARLSVPSSAAFGRSSGTRYAPWVSKGQWDPYWTAQPRHRTVTELKEARRQSMKPHMSFDVDGDGVVSNQDLYLSTKFDDDGNGVLDDEERRELRKAMVQSAIAKYRRLPRAKGKDTEELIKAFTKNLDETVDRPDFLERYNHLHIQTMISSTADSTKMETVLQPLIVEQREKLIGAFSNFDENGDGVRTDSLSQLRGPE
jgi:Ca2+-binding EF-hand superfamily protein